MSAVATATVVTPKKKATGAGKPKKAAPTHPKYSEMIAYALNTLKERGGSSRQAILKCLVSKYNVEERVCNQHLKMALKNGVKNGTLKQAKGTGASGSFKLGEKKASKSSAAAKKPKVAKKSPTKKPAAKKAVKKAPSKSPKKAGTKSPKKAVKKAAAKPKKAAAKPKKTPVKAKKASAAKAKKAPAKKAAAKKA